MYNKGYIMKTVDLKQGSPEWLEFRRSRITATDFATFMSYKGICKNPYNKSVHKLIEDKINKVELEDNKYLKRGRELEDIIRDCYNLDNLSNYQPIVVEGAARTMASLDGYDFSLGSLIEIKTTSKSEEEWDDLIDYYKWQVVHQMYVTNTQRHKAIIIMVDQQTNSKVKIYNLSDYIKPEEITIDLWLEYCAEFLDMLDNFGNDNCIVNDYLLIEAKIKELEEEKARIRDLLILSHPDGWVTEHLTIAKQQKSTMDYKKFVADSNLSVPDKYKKLIDTYVIRTK